MSALPLYVGIDTGGSGTRALLADGHGQILAAGRGGPSGISATAASRRQLQRALATALGPIAKRIGSESCVVYAGIRGVSVPGRRETTVVELQHRLPTARVHVSNDAVIALNGALGERDGVAVLAGTGSIAMARSGDGREGRAGGYGYLIGDEGSAFWLGRAAVDACLRSLDGRDPPSSLASLTLQAFDVRSATDVV